MKKMFFAICFLFVACATAPQEPPVDPAVTIRAPREDVVAALIADMAAQGYPLVQSSENLLVFGRRDDSVMAMAIYGSRYDRVPESRVSYSVAETQGLISVRGTAAMVTNPGSGYERNHNVTGNASRWMYNTLARVKTATDGYAVQK